MKETLKEKPPKGKAQSVRTVPPLGVLFLNQKLELMLAYLIQLQLSWASLGFVRGLDYAPFPPEE